MRRIFVPEGDAADDEPIFRKLQLVTDNIGVHSDRRLGHSCDSKTLGCQQQGMLTLRGARTGDRTPLHTACPPAPPDRIKDLWKIPFLCPPGNHRRVPTAGSVTLDVPGMRTGRPRSERPTVQRPSALMLASIALNIAERWL
jgi:hypothetical protein